MNEEHLDPSVSHRASRAFVWSFGNTILARFGTLAIGVALARVLGPEEFGIFAIGTVTLLAILSFNELGVSLAVVRWRDDPRAITPTINTVAVASSVVLTIAVVAGAPWISSALGDARATAVVRVLAISILLNGLVATPAAVLQREFMQKQRTIADQVNTWLGTGLSLAFALMGWGAMSLAIGRLIASVVFAAMLIRWSPVPYRLGWDSAIAARLLRFGLPLAASSIVVFASGYADQAIVGSLAGASALGFYVLAYNLAAWPVSIFSLPLRAVAPATFSALKSNPGRMNHGFVRVLTVLSCVALPACLAISAAARPVVDFVYGPAWGQAAPVLVWMAVLAALKIWFELAYDFLVVQGRSGVLMLVQICSFTVTLPLMLAVVGPHGGAGVAAVQVLVALTVAAPLYLFSLHRTGLPALQIGTAVAVPVLAGVCVWFIGRGVSLAVDSSLGAMAVAGALTLAVISLLVLWQRDTVMRLRSAYQGRVPA